jgi:hypothetical protein
MEAVRTSETFVLLLRVYMLPYLRKLSSSNTNLADYGGSKHV